MGPCRYYPDWGVTHSGLRRYIGTRGGGRVPSVPRPEVDCQYIAVSEFTTVRALAITLEPAVELLENVDCSDEEELAACRSGNLPPRALC